MNEESMQSKGGHARAESLSPVERTEIARKAAETRWSKRTREVLYIPLGDEQFASIPFPMTEDAMEILLATLALWKTRLVPAPQPPPQPGLSGSEGGE